MSTVDEIKALGNQAFAAKQYDKSIELYTEAIDMDPSNHVLYSNRSGSYCAAGKYAQAAADARKVIEIKPDWVRGHTRLGAALEGQGDFEGAAAAYEAALKIDPSNANIQEDLQHVKSQIRTEQMNNPFANLFRPENFDALRFHPQTSKFFEDPSFVNIINDIKTNPKNLSNYMNDKRVEVCLQVLLAPFMQQMQGAAGEEPQEEEPEPKPEPKKAAPKEEPKPEVKPEEPKNEGAEEEKLKGNACFKNGDMDGAIEHYDKAIELDPYNVTLHSNKATCLIRQKKYEEAIAVATKAIENGREHGAGFEAIAKAYTKIATAEAALDNLEGAINALNSSLLEKKDPTVKRELTRIQQLKAKRDAAAYENPEIAEKEKLEGNTCFRNGDLPGAIAHYNEAIKRAPRNPAMYSNRAAAYSKLGEMPMALKDCDKAIEIDPNFIKAYTRKGYCHFQMKEYHKAIDAYNAALKIDKNNAEAIGGLESVNAAINKNAYSAPDQEQIRHAMADPEIQRILADPGIQQVLRDMQENPMKAQAHLADPSIRDAMMKLRAAGILR